MIVLYLKPSVQILRSSIFHLRPDLPPLWFCQRFAVVVGPARSSGRDEAQDDGHLHTNLKIVTNHHLEDQKELPV